MPIKYAYVNAMLEALTSQMIMASLLKSSGSEKPIALAQVLVNSFRCLCRDPTQGLDIDVAGETCNPSSYRLWGIRRRSVKQVMERQKTELFHQLTTRRLFNGCQEALRQTLTQAGDEARRSMAVTGTRSVEPCQDDAVTGSILQHLASGDVFCWAPGRSSSSSLMSLTH